MRGQKPADPVVAVALLILASCGAADAPPRTGGDATTRSPTVSPGSPTGTRILTYYVALSAGRTLTATTAAVEGVDFERAREVLDAMIRTLEAL